MNSDYGRKLTELANIDLGTQRFRLNAKGELSLMEKPKTFEGRFYFWIKCTFGELKEELDLAKVAKQVEKLIQKIPQGQEAEMLTKLKSKLTQLEEKANERYQNVFKNCISAIDGKIEPVPAPALEKKKKSVSLKNSAEGSQTERKTSSSSEIAQAPLSASRGESVESAKIAEILNNDLCRQFLKSTECERALFGALGHKVGEENVDQIKKRVEARIIREKVDLSDASSIGRVALIIFEERVSLAGVKARDNVVVSELLVLVRDLEEMAKNLPSESLQQLYLNSLHTTLSGLTSEIQKVVSGTMKIRKFKKPIESLFSVLSEKPAVLWLHQYHSQMVWIASQGENPDKILGAGVCWAIGIHVSAYLTRYPNVSGKKLHEHLSGKAGELDNPTAIFDLNKYRSLQALLQLEKKVSLPSSILKRFDVKENENHVIKFHGRASGEKIISKLAKLNNAKAFEFSSGSFMLEMYGKESAHLITCQVSKREGKYRFIDPNCGMFEFEDFKSFKEGFITFIDACYADQYNDYWTRNLIPVNKP